MSYEVDHNYLPIFRFKNPIFLLSVFIIIVEYPQMNFLLLLNIWTSIYIYFFPFSSLIKKKKYSLLQKNHKT